MQPFSGATTAADVRTTSTMITGQTFGSTVGALEIGIMVELFLFGLMSVQTLQYYKKFPNDPWPTRTLVAIIWILELAHSVLTAHSVYWITFIHYGRNEALDRFPGSLIAAIFLSGIIGPAVQAFFANRVRKLTPVWAVACIIWLLCLLRSVSLLAAALIAHELDSISRFGEKWQWLLITSLAISLVADYLIAGSLCCHLFYRRGSGGIFARTKRMIDRLILWAIQTGLLTSIGTVTTLVLFLMVENLAWLAVFLIIPKLFSNSLMASLNAQASFCTVEDQVDFMGNTTFFRSHMGQSNMLSIVAFDILEPTSRERKIP
ncbi:hypothetical protein LshimejAT787_1802220 [Lyophyllum shimeji]|uniref:DUF6534 domain-containing protein n=1 Tax=Lyophyllum shimeji TaxID=47721 RepID=A0A9P3PZJ9_LYOSH|nr:hypothetical protein LshimejAT787_1802220 [Lyophyllum shimeji]